MEITNYDRLVRIHLELLQLEIDSKISKDDISKVWKDISDLQDKYELKENRITYEEIKNYAIDNEEGIINE